MASPPSRHEFLRSRFYLCCLKYDKRNEEKMKHLQELLEKVDQNEKRRSQPPKKNRTTSRWVLPDCDNRSSKGHNSQEATAILSADKEGSDWVFDESEGEYVLTLGGVTVMKIPTAMYNRLRPFQRDAVKWAAGVGPIGGILADDMGMGKTFMSIATLGARMRVKRVRMVLVVAPVSVMAGWAEEGNKFLSKFVDTVRIVKVHGGSQQDRKKAIRNAWKSSSYEKPYVIISSWGLAASVRTMNMFLPPSGRHWDYVILDEAHVIKNHKSNRYKCCHRICNKPGTNRLLLTGTVFQNDVPEIWSIFHMATAGKVLGKLKAFMKDYGKPIRDARCRNASSHAMKEAAKANKLLQDTLQPYILLRKKIDFLKDELPAKYETCVWVKPSKQQARMYKEKVQSNFALTQNMMSNDKDLANKARMSAFQVIAQLRNLCGHPLRLLKGGPEGDIRSALEQTDLSTVLHGSKKLELVLHMVKGFKAEDHKTLVFSQSTQNLDVIQYVLSKQSKLKIARLDGSVSEKRRQDMVELFQNGMFDVMLLSTGAGGVGITLTRASRVIVYDPDWTPSKDAQAVDRAYRIGQTQEVRVYRLFLACSIEEKMYEKQVHKTGLEKTIFTEGSNPETRYFDKNELCKVFEQVPDGSCELLKRFEKEGVGQVLDAHRHDLVRAHPSVVGISNHSNVYRQKRKGAFSDATSGPTIDAKRLKQTIVTDDEETRTIITSEEEAIINAEKETIIAAEKEATRPDEEETMVISEKETMITSEKETIIASEKETTSNSEGETMVASKEEISEKETPPELPDTVGVVSEGGGSTVHKEGLVVAI